MPPTTPTVNIQQQNAMGGWDWNRPATTSTGVTQHTRNYTQGVTKAQHQRSHRRWCDEDLLHSTLWDCFLMLNSFSPDVFRNRFWDGQPVSHHKPHRLGPQHPHTLSQAKHTGPICRHRQPRGELWRSVYHISTCTCLSSPLLPVE